MLNGIPGDSKPLIKADGFTGWDQLGLAIRLLHGVFLMKKAAYKAAQHLLKLLLNQLVDRFFVFFGQRPVLERFREILDRLVFQRIDADIAFRIVLGVRIVDFDELIRHA